MSERVIRGFLQAVGLLSRGKLEKRLNEELARVIETLEQHPEEKAQASLTLEVEFTKLADRIDLKPVVKVKLPKEKGFPATTFWPVGNALSVEHPSQTDMFAGPRPAGERASA